MLNSLNDSEKVETEALKKQADKVDNCEKGAIIAIITKEYKIKVNAMIFKINILNLIHKFPRLVKSSVTLGFLKIYFKDVKKDFEKNSNELS